MKNKGFQLGDKHNGNQFVTLKYSENGEPIISKPRNCKTEVAFDKFLEGFGEMGLSQIPQTVEVLSDNENSHEQAYVHHLPAKSTEDVDSYFFKCGVLLFFAYLLGSYDLHCENIIASANSPVLIDLETLLSAEPVRRTSRLDFISLKDSVLKSHLLPNWIAVEGKICDCSGFTGNLNSDKNILFYDNKPVTAYNYTDKITDGFSEAYKLTLQNIDVVETLIENFSDCTFRQLLRPTDVYDTIIKFINLFDDEEKRKTTAYSLLARAYQKDIDKDRLKKAEKILKHEVFSILNGEIPLFNTYGNSRSLYDSTQMVYEDFYEISPVESAKNKLHSLSESNLDSQVKIIYQSLQAVKPLSTKTTKINRGDFLTLVSDILDENSIPALSSKWMVLEAGKNNSLCLQSAGVGLYNGLTGILCFYASAYYKTGNSKFLEKLLHYYSSYREVILNNNFSIALTDTACSFSDGLAGQLSALNHIYELTGEKIFYQDLISLLNRISFDNTKINNIEIMGGAIALSLLLPKINDDITKKIAKQIIPHIREAKPTLTGMAHGVAGIVLAMSALGYILNDNSLDDTILNLLEYENSHYDCDANNWQDLRDKNRKGFMKGWCSGTPGIAISRNKMLKYTSNQKILDICRRDIENASVFISSVKEIKRDSLCCGSASVLVAASQLGLKNDVLFNAVLSRLNNSNLNLYNPLNTCIENCGLMQGISGIGYTLAMYGDTLCGDMLI